MKKLKWIAAGLLLLSVAIKAAVSPQGSPSGTTLEQVEPISFSASDLRTLPTLSNEQLSALLDTLDAVPQISADFLPQSGTFWSLANPSWPPLPVNVNGLSVWQMSGGSFLLNDLNVDYAAPQLQTRTAMRAMGLDTPSFDETGGSSGSDTNVWTFTFDTNGLWLEITGVSNVAALNLHNTLADVQYELLSKPDLTLTQWLSEGMVLGSELTNITPATVTVGNRTTNLFFWAKSWQDSDGSGLPDWWQMQNFGHLGVDPYGDPDGDGWSNLQEFQNGTNPNTFNTPAAPQGLTVTYNANYGTATLTWLPSPGPVTSYTLVKYDYQTGQTTNFTVSASGSSFVDDLSADDPLFDLGIPQLYADYSFQANFGTNGSSAVAAASVQGIAAPIAKMTSGPQGRIYCAFSGLPADTAKVRFCRQQNTGISAPALGDYLQFNAEINLSSPLDDGYFDIPVATITNGICRLPDAETPAFYLYTFWAQTVRSNGVASSWAELNDQGGKAVNMPLVDARAQLKDNLRFHLRAANTLGPFAFLVVDGDGQYPYQRAAFGSPTNYVCADFYNGWYFDELRPIYDNCLLRNFVFDQNNLAANGSLNTGCYGGNQYVGYNHSGHLFITNYPTYWFDFAGYLTASNPAVPNSWLTATQTTWILPAGGDGFANVAAGSRNYYGLPYLSVKDAYLINSQLYLGTYNPGAAAPGGLCYREAAQPVLQTLNYYFARPDMDPMPASGSLSPTSTTPLMFTDVGRSTLQVAGYARLAIQNGYTNKFAYLGQYFDQAYQIADNGSVTTNRAGILSPFGYFFATHAGPAALVTMPDIDTGERGTCTVYAVSLQLDANHDGFMDLNFNGADATSLSQPMQVWVNNDYDRGHSVDLGDFEQDDLGPKEVLKYHLVPDCQYAPNGLPAIPCTRDLEDYFRLWIPGLAAVPTNYAVWLSLYGEGQIQVFRAVEASGGTNYLFDETTASNQVAKSTLLYVGLLTSDSPILLNSRTNEHYIFCGARAGRAQVNLQIFDTNQYAQVETSAYLNIKDIKQMYERWTVGDEPGSTKQEPFSIAVKAVDDVTTPFQYLPLQDTNTPYILFVHGWNMSTYDKDRFAETSFKRLYWQGYQGRFGSFRWPTYYDFPFGEMSAQAVQPRNFDDSESNAWTSAVGLLNKLTDLNSQYPGQVYLMAHSMGNVVAGEALRLATNQVVNTYVAMQAAVAAHAYDPNTPNRSLTSTHLTWDSGTPDRYANYWTNGASCYFNSPLGAGTYVNFYNTNDWALRLLWTLDQDSKPDDAPTSYPGYHYNASIGFHKIIGAGTNNIHILNFPANTYEIFSFCDEARCQALGRQQDVGGKFAGNEVGLDANPYGFHEQHKFHSGEFRSDNAQRWQFWNSVLINFELKSP